MQISPYSTNIYQTPTSTQTQLPDPSLISETSTSVDTSYDNAATLELTGAQQLEMQEYQPYSIDLVKTNYITATSTKISSSDIYNEWFKNLGTEADMRLLQSYNTIDSIGRENFTADEQTQLYNEQFDWLNQQLIRLQDDLTNNSSSTEVERAYFYDKGIRLLDNIDMDLWTAIEDYRTTGEKDLIKFEESFNTYKTFENSLGGHIADYITNFQKVINSRSSTITNDNIQGYHEEFLKWTNDLFDSLSFNSLNLQNDSSKTQLYLKDEMGTIFDIAMPDVWNSLLRTINDKNNALEYAYKVQREQVEAQQMSRIQVNYTTGQNKSAVRLSTSKPSPLDPATSFTVEDSSGRTKKLYITFTDERLKKEFDKRIKAAGLDAKTISIKKFDEIMKELKKSLKEVGEIDMDNLFRKLNKGEKDQDFEVAINRFLSNLKRAL